jgi:PAS domain S-box-containing protein
LIADTAPVPMWLTGLDRTRSFVNQAYREFLNVGYEEAVTFDWRTIIHPDDASRIFTGSEAGEASLQPFSLEGRYRRHDGSWRWLRSYSRPSFDENGRHQGFIGVAFDVTDAKDAEIALRDHEAKLSAIIGQATAGIAQVDLAGRFTMVNDRYCEIVGRTRSELMQLTMQEITHPDDLPNNLVLFEAAVAKAIPYTHEKRMVRPDGSLVWVNNSVSVLQREGQPAYGVLAVSLDVTERRRAEEAFRKNAESIRLAIESAGMATWEVDLDTMSGEWSPNRFDILGLPRATDLRGRPDEWLAVVHPEDRAMATGAVRNCLTHGTSFQLEYRIVRADNGEERWLQSHGSRIDEGANGPARFVSVSFDVTDRHRAETNLRDSEWRFRTIFEQANDYIFTSDLDQRVTSCNPAVCAALGYTPEEAIGMSFADFVDEGAFGQTTAMLQAKLDHGGTTRHTITVKTREGHRLIWEINSRLMLNGEGQPIGLHAIARDVTEARRLEQHQQLLIDELNHRVKNMLAIVQAVAQQTFRGETNSASLATFQGRLSALSTAHNLLTRDNWTPAELTQVVTDALAPHDAAESRFRLTGPAVMIQPKTAITLALAFHELATNAVKHGALSEPGGHIDIAWQIQPGDPEPRLRLMWKERGGPLVETPSRRGFGTRMIERGLAAELGGTVEIRFEEAGLICLVDAPLPKTG